MTNREPFEKALERPNGGVVPLQNCEGLNPMQKMPTQELVYQISNAVFSFRNQTDMFDPEFARIGHRLG
jgi:hypothetical protein